MKEKVQKLRDVTGAGVMDCKRALEESGGDFENAVQIIRRKGFAKAATKSDRATTAGVIDAYVHNDRVGVLIELLCETDFVARTKEFKELAHELAMQVAAMDPQSVDELLAQPYIKDISMTVNDMLTQHVAKIGENIKIARFTRYAL